ncbi:MAG: ribonuclease HII [Bacteroidota bacterium]|nr:ribonuclease HII [Bacteroidota bacterium]
MVELKYSENKIEAGCDEAGRGCLAGPVFAAAVILPDDFDISELDDSKKLSEKKRNKLRKIIIEKAVAWYVAKVNNKEIDKINILNASIKAMHLALDKLTIRPELILVDGNKFKPYNDIEHLTIIKGDSKFASIAAASILAKTFRDDYMKNIDKKYPVYLWKKNKGYATLEHKNIVFENGLTPFHRKSFCNFYFQKTINYKNK